MSTTSKTDRTTPTPTPWEIAPHSDQDDHIDICAGYRQTPDGRSRADWIAELAAENVDGGRERNQANAEFIVRACNSHEELVEIARLVVAICDGIEPESLVGMARAALAKADGQ